MAVNSTHIQIEYAVTNFAWPNQSTQEAIASAYVAAWKTAFAAAGGGLVAGLDPLLATINTQMAVDGTKVLRVVLTGYVVPDGILPTTSLAHVYTASQNGPAIATLAGFTSGGSITSRGVFLQVTSPE